MFLLCHNNRNNSNNNTKNNDYHCYNYRWTLVIIGVIILMTVSVVLATVFPYRGDDVDLLRGAGGGGGVGDANYDVDSVVDSDVMMSSSSNAVGDVHDGIHSIGGIGKKKDEDGTNSHSSSEGANNTNDGGSSSSSVLPSGGRGDDNNEEQKTSNELLSPLDDSSSTISDNMNQQHGGGGLFDYSDSTPYDETKQHQQQSQSQAQEVASSINTSSSISSCQTNLQQADIDMNKIIDVSEYISFLRHYNVVNNNNIEDEEEEEVVVVENNDATTATNNPLLGSVNDFEELPIEHQVNFNHLATIKMTQSNGGGSSNGIPIASLEEIQKVCLYLSSMGSSAIDEFDWDQISTTLKQQQQNEGM